MNRLVKSVMIGLAGIQGFSLAAGSRPKLVVGIIVDQLRTDYLETLHDKFGEGGFLRLMENGAFLKDVDFKIPNIDAASAAAIIQTGSYPRQNGITGAYVYSAAAKNIIPIFQDPNFIGNSTSETYSPSALRVTTINDEISADGGGIGKIHSIAPDAAESIVLSGHSGNSAFWINDETGKWSSTTYYTSPPSSIQNRNFSTPLLTRLDTMAWVPLKGADYYPDISFNRKMEGFKYTFPRSDRDVFKMYKLSPYVNSDITDAATDYVKLLNLGKHPEAIDVLNIGYTLAPYSMSGNSDGKYELEDSYLRLDQNLERLFKEIDRHIGLDNILVYVASTGYFVEPDRDRETLQLPGGNFSVKRALSLLNSYLSAKYGNGSYISQYAGGHIYLDHSQIESKGLDVAKIAEESRDFLVRMSGVSDTFTVSDLMSPTLPQLEGHRLGTDPKSAGDIILEFNPGWNVTDDSRYPPQSQPNKTSAYQTPVFIMGNGIARQVIETPVEATSIAPTIAKNLRIRSPNSALSKPIILK